jgi:hypothetical protein
MRTEYGASREREEQMGIDKSQALASAKKTFALGYNETKPNEVLASAKENSTRCQCGRIRHSRARSAGGKKKKLGKGLERNRTDKALANALGE